MILIPVLQPVPAINDLTRLHVRLHHLFISLLISLQRRLSATIASSLDTFVFLALAFVANLSPAEWTIDSGATKHMCTHRQWFCDIRIKTETGFKMIKDVLYVPDLSANLISVSALTKVGLKVNCYGTVCVI